MLYIVYSVSVMVLLIETDVLRLNTEPKYLYVYVLGRFILINEE